MRTLIVIIAVLGSDLAHAGKCDHLKGFAGWLDRHAERLQNLSQSSWDPKAVFDQFLKGPKEKVSDWRKKGAPNILECHSRKSRLIPDTDFGSGFYWVKDTAGHGGGGTRSGCAWKLYKPIKHPQYQVIGCAGADGQFIQNKHESMAGKTIHCGK